MSKSNKYTGVFLILILSFSLFIEAAYIVYFVFKRAEITEKYCTNKMAPNLKCDGKCHLKKFVAAEKGTDNENSLLPELISFKLSPFILIPYITYSADLKLSVKYQEYPEEKHLSIIALFSDNPFVQFVFHPPAS